MPIYIEIAQTNGGSAASASDASNGATSIVLADTSTNTLTIDPSTWLSTGDLGHPKKVWEDSYHPAMSNAVWTERVIAD